MKKTAGWILFLLAVIWNFISFLGSFYFPFLSPAYKYHPVAVRLKELWYWFLPGDLMLLLSLFLSACSMYLYFSHRKELSLKLMTLAGWLAVAKGVLNTGAYAQFFNSPTPSFLNIFSGVIILVASFLLKNSRG